MRRKKQQSKEYFFTRLVIAILFLGLAVWIGYALYNQNKVPVHKIKINEQKIKQKLLSLPKVPYKKDRKKIRGFGDLVVNSTPPAHGVFIDDRKVASGTPVRIRRIKAGVGHKLVLKRRGYENYELLFSVEPGKTKKLDVNLLPKTDN